MTELPSNYFQVLASSAEKVTSIHFEPFGYQVPEEEEGPVSKLHREYFTEHSWNRNFFETITNAHKNREIEITYLHKNALAGDPSCPTSLAMWRSVKAKFN